MIDPVRPIHPNHPDTGVRARRPGRAAAIALLLACAIGAGAGDARAAETGGLVAALERAPAVVVAEVVDVTPLEHAGYLASLRIERSLRPDVQPPETLKIAWEEPVPSLAPRLEAGRRIVAAADPLPTASIWRIRVPDADARAKLVGLAGDGVGYLLRPGMAELDVLEHYLALDAAARDGDGGALQLARMCVVGQPRLADDAAVRLAGMPELASHLTPPAAEAIVEALLRNDVPATRETLLALIGSERPLVLRAPLEARIRAAGDSVPPVLLAALGALDGGLDEEQSLELLANRSPEMRQAAAQSARGPRAIGLLRELARSDPEPAVRATAVTRLVAVAGESALHDATRALEDPVAEVRLAAVRAAASLDPVAVEPLRDIALGDRPEAARAALAALSLMGDEGHEVLAGLARDHPDEGMRTLAGIAVGQPIGHRD